MAPSWLHLGPILASSWLHLGFILAQLSPDKANIGQQRPNIALTWANTSQHRSSLSPTHVNLAPTYRHLGHILALRSPKSGSRLGVTQFFKKTVLAPSTRKKHQRRRLFGSFGLILGSFWAHFGLSLAPSWPHLGPILAYLGPSWPHLGFILAQLSQGKANISQQRPNMALT